MKQRKSNPNEMRGDVIERESNPGQGLEVQEETCPACDMKKEEWKENKGRGHQADDALYCCRGCAEATGCTCGD